MSLSNWFKPSTADASIRLRNSGFALVTLLATTHLLPVPSPLKAIFIVSLSQDVGSWMWMLCSAESLLFVVLSLNLVQSLWALQHPRAQPPPVATPSRALRAMDDSFSPSRSLVSSEFKARSPLPQKPFSASVYAPSPVSSPSRTLDYSVNSSMFDTSFGSSLSLSSPSPSVSASPLSAFRGRRGAGNARPLDGSFLRSLARADDD